VNALRDFEPHRRFVIELAEASGDLIRPYFAAADLKVELKPDETPVTAADRGAEELMREMIRKRFPDHGISGEEYGAEDADAEFVWVLDPIDGTKAFASGTPLFGTLIALMHEGQPVLGAIHQPVLRQLCLGDGLSTTLNGRPVRVRPPRPLSESTLLCSDWTASPYQDEQRFRALTGGVRLFRTWGDCYGYLLVATGWADIMCDPIMNPWDIAALVPVIRGAGGVITDWQGLEPVNAASTVATTSQAMHDEVIAALNP
jgi:histidinol phosphatase-like enzyme (inositol monophosphatase family)